MGFSKIARFNFGFSRDKKLCGAGFTLLELLVVLVIISVATGLIVVRGTPGDSRYLENQAQKLSQILRIAQLHAVLKNKNVRFSTTKQGFSFEVPEEDDWVPLEEEDLLRARQWERSDVQVTLRDEGRDVSFFVIPPVPGLMAQEIVFQLNRTVLRLTRSTGGRFIVGQAQKVLVEGELDFSEEF